MNRKDGFLSILCQLPLNFFDYNNILISTKKYAEHISVNTVRIISYRGHTFKMPLSWGGEEGLLISRCFEMGGEGGVPLVYDVINEKINCNRKQAKEMK